MTEEKTTLCGVDVIIRKLSPRPGDVITVEVPKNTSVDGVNQIRDQLRGLVTKDSGIKILIFDEGLKMDVIKNLNKLSCGWPYIEE